MQTNEWHRYWEQQDNTPAGKQRVEKLQLGLRALGFYRSAIDKNFGPLNAEGFDALPDEFKALTPDALLEALAQKVTEHTAALITRPAALTREETRQMQAGLRLSGHDAGPIDGIPKSLTGRGVHGFASEHQLIPHGTAENAVEFARARGWARAHAPASPSPPTSAAAPAVRRVPSFMEASDVVPASTSREDGKLVVVLDAGHGEQLDFNKDGRIDRVIKNAKPHRDANVDKGTREADITRSVALKTAEILRARGVEVVLTQDTIDTKTFPSVEEGLAERPKIAKEADADMFISLHCDHEDPQAQGARALYHTKAKPNSVQLANALLESLEPYQGRFARHADAMEMNNRTGRLRPQGLMVLNPNAQGDRDAALIELGFLSNKADAERLASAEWQEETAQRLADGIERHARQTNRWREPEAAAQIAEADRAYTPFEMHPAHTGASVTRSAGGRTTNPPG